jgi:hypothetical protein
MKEWCCNIRFTNVNLVVRVLNNRKKNYKFTTLLMKWLKIWITLIHFYTGLRRSTASSHPRLDPSLFGYCSEVPTYKHPRV